MSHVSTTVKRAFILGVQEVAAKLGTVSPVEHKARSAREPVNFAADKQESLWREMDREPSITGEESALGMPSAGGANKSAGIKDFAKKEWDIFSGKNKRTMEDAYLQAQAKADDAAKAMRGVTTYEDYAHLPDDYVRDINQAFKKTKDTAEAAESALSQAKYDQQTRHLLAGGLAGTGALMSLKTDPPNPYKQAGLSDGGYGDVEGPYAQGGFDANQHLVDRDKRLRSAIEEAFKSNESHDQSYGPESAMTQPKIGAAVPGAGLGSAMAKMNPMKPPMPTLPKPPKIQGGVDSRAPTLTKGHNLQHGVQEQAYSGNAAQSIASPDSRYLGSPV